MQFELLHPADQLVMFMDRIYKYGMTTTSGGNLSIRDTNGDIWITPAGIDKGSLTNKDIICVKPDGSIIGKHKPSSELPFHMSTYRKRPDVNAILHAHPPALVSFSIVRKLPNVCLLPNVKTVCGDVGMAVYGLPGSEDLGEKIASVFERGIRTVLLENHGVVVAGEDMFKAFMTFETLDACARLEIGARSIGKTISLDAAQIGQYQKSSSAGMDEFIPNGYTSLEREARRELCGLVRRSYDQGLFTSTQGTISARVGDDSFIITPGMKDRKYIDVGDLVRIESGKKEAGKTPDSSAVLHRRIYEKYPHVQSVITAQPQNIMAFAVTDETLDSRTIPESYILLRSIPKIPYGADFLQPKKTAELFTKQCPIVLVNNGCIIVTGSSPLNAFDRLEVAEYSAKALISSRILGNVVAINDEQVADLIKAFNLD